MTSRARLGQSSGIFGWTEQEREKVRKQKMREVSAFAREHPDFAQHEKEICRLLNGESANAS